MGPVGAQAPPKGASAPQGRKRPRKRPTVSAPVDCPPTARVRPGRLPSDCPCPPRPTQQKRVEHLRRFQIGSRLPSDCPCVRPGRLQNRTEACRIFAKVPDQLERGGDGGGDAGGPSKLFRNMRALFWTRIAALFFVTCEHTTDAKPSFFVTCEHSSGRRHAMLFFVTCEHCHVILWRARHGNTVN